MRVALVTAALSPSDARLRRLRDWADRFLASGDEPVLVWAAETPPPEAVGASWPSLRWVETNAWGEQEAWGGGLEILPSRRVESHLSQGAYDLALIPADGGLAFLSLQAQRTRVSLRDTAIGVVVDDLCLQARRRRGEFSAHPSRELRTDWAERRAIALAPKLIIGNAAVERWMGENDCRGSAEAVCAEGFDWVGFVKGEKARLGRGGASRLFVSVCVAHRNQPHYLPKALASLAATEYPDFEVVVVDDGSDLPEATAVLEEERTRYPNWRFERIEWAGPGAARNAAVRFARGDVLLFFDSDNVAMPHLVESLAEALRSGDLDVVNCYNSGFGVAGPVYPVQDFQPLGPAMPLALLGNYCGDTVMAIRRRAFEGLGGFPESRAIDYEDWEFWARIIVAGIEWEVLPRSLYWYRFSPNSRCLSVRLGAALQPILSVFEGLLGKEAIRLARDFALPVRYRNSELETESAKVSGLVARLCCEAETSRGRAQDLARRLEEARHREDRLRSELNRPIHLFAHQVGEGLARIPRVREALIAIFRTARQCLRLLLLKRLS